MKKVITIELSIADALAAIREKYPEMPVARAAGVKSWGDHHVTDIEIGCTNTSDIDETVKITFDETECKTRKEIEHDRKKSKAKSARRAKKRG
jgi:hypothetical protein